MNGLHPASSPMLSALHATAPFPALADKLMLFGQFVGSWDLQIVYYARDGTVARRMPGEWHFGWVLEGRAIQDVWIAPKRASRALDTAVEEFGATLRFYDTKLGDWRSTWIGPVKGTVRPFAVRETEDEIILDGSFARGASTRWIFSRITPDSFQWRAVESCDGWKTCRLEQEMFATRQSTGPSTHGGGNEN